MEACIIICSKNKSVKNKVVFINAVNDVVRKNAESYLTDKHIEKISSAYFNHTDIDGFCKVVSNEDIKNADLNISLYASPQMNKERSTLSVEESITNWKDVSSNMHNCFTTLKSLING